MSRARPLRPGPAGGAAPPVTIEDVARHCGVSRQTVSNVLNGTGRVGAQTRERVLAAVDAMGFTPHHAAASLRSGRARRFAYVLPRGEPREENTILLEFLQRLVAAAAARGQQTLVIQPGGDGPELDDLGRLVRSRAIDAVVLSAVAARDPRVAHLTRLGVPFACFGQTDPAARQAWVDVDNQAGVRQAVREVTARGHRSIAFVGYDSRARWDREREAGYRDGISAAGLRGRLTRVPGDDPVPVIRRLLEGPGRPTALITGSDILAGACYAAAGQAGLAVGRDLAVVGFDGTLAARLLAPSLATVRIPLAPIAEAIVARLLGDRPNDTGELIDAEFVPGDSLGPAPGSPPAG